MAFWLAVDKQQVKLASSLMDFDISIRKIVTTAFKLSEKGKPVPEFRVKQQEEGIMPTAEKDLQIVTEAGQTAPPQLEGGTAIGHGLLDSQNFRVNDVGISDRYEGGS